MPLLRCARQTRFGIFPVRQIASEQRFQFLDFGTEEFGNSSDRIRRQIRKCLTAAKDQLAKRRFPNARDQPVEPLPLKQVCDRRGRASVEVKAWVSHVVRGMDTAHLRLGEFETLNADEIGQSVYILLRVTTKVVISSGQDAVGTQAVPPCFEISRISAGFYQLWIAHNGLFEVPRNHSEGTFDAVMRVHPLDRVAENADHLRLRIQARYSLARLAGCEVSRSDFAHETMFGRLPIVQQKPL